MTDRTGRDASLGPLHTPDGSTRKHGGEEGFLRSPTIEVESPELGNKVPSAAPGESNAAQLGESNATSPPAARVTQKIDDLREWTTTDVVNWLFGLQVEKQAITFVTQNKVNGAWLLELIDYTECHEILREEFHIVQAFKRLTFISKLRELANATAKTASQGAKQSAEAQTLPGQGQVTSPTPQKTSLVGEKSIQIPAYPKQMDDSGFPSPHDFKQWCMSLKVWACIESAPFAKLIQHLYDNPELRVDPELYKKLSEGQVHIDIVLGVHLYTTCPRSIKKKLVKAENYEVLPGQTSGLKIISFVSQKVNKRNESRWLSINEKLTQRDPLTNINELQGELDQIDKLMDQMDHQGHSFSSRDLYAVLNKAVKKLVLQDGSQGKDHPSLVIVLALPVQQCQERSPLDGEILFEKLTEIAENVATEDKWTHLRNKKPRVPVGQPVGAAMKGPRPPPNHISHVPEGKPCVNERDNGKCLLEGCKGIHGSNEWTGVECTNPCYTKHLICPGFLCAGHNKGQLCKDKHSQKPHGMKEILAAKELCRKEFPGMWGVMEE